MRRLFVYAIATLLTVLGAVPSIGQSSAVRIGDERAVPRHLTDGEEFRLTVPELVDFGRLLFTANWTVQDGAGRPLSKGTGQPLSDGRTPLRGGRTFNRFSGPSAMSCAACHRHPFGIPGGGGDFVSNTFEGAERFDFVTFDRTDRQLTRGGLDESGSPVTLLTIGNRRSTPALFGAGYLELLARQMTAELQRIRDSIQPGQTKPLVAKGIAFGVLARRTDGRWVTDGVEGLPPQSLAISASSFPTLAVRPWQQSGTALSLREIVATSYHQHIGIQATERFGANTDPDGDRVANELTRADVTAVVAFIATLPAPGRLVPETRTHADRIAAGERLFAQVGCSSCHVPALLLDKGESSYAEPGPPGDGAGRRAAAGRAVTIDLTAANLPQPRLLPADNVISVPAFTDFKLHDISDPADETMAEPLDLNQPMTSSAFRQGNRRFLTRRLWDVGSRAQFFHDGRFTTIRDAVLAHAGEALAQRRAFQALSAAEQEALLQFLGSLQMVPPDRHHSLAR